MIFSIEKSEIQLIICNFRYTGKYCEVQMPLCNTQPCFNEGICEATAGTFRCICAQSSFFKIQFTILNII